MRGTGFFSERGNTSSASLVGTSSDIRNTSRGGIGGLNTPTNIIPLIGTIGAALALGAVFGIAGGLFFLGITITKTYNNLKKDIENYKEYYEREKKEWKELAESINKSLKTIAHQATKIAEAIERIDKNFDKLVKAIEQLPRIIQETIDTAFITEKLSLLKSNNEILNKYDLTNALGIKEDLPLIEEYNNRYIEINNSLFSHLNKYGIAGKSTAFILTSSSLMSWMRNFSLIELAKLKLRKHYKAPKLEEQTHLARYFKWCDSVLKELDIYVKKDSEGAFFYPYKATEVKKGYVYGDGGDFGYGVLYRFDHQKSTFVKDDTNPREKSTFAKQYSKDIMLEVFFNGEEMTLQLPYKREKLGSGSSRKHYLITVNLKTGDITEKNINETSIKAFAVNYKKCNPKPLAYYLGIIKKIYIPNTLFIAHNADYLSKMLEYVTKAKEALNSTIHGTIPSPHNPADEVRDLFNSDNSLNLDKARVKFNKVLSLSTDTSLLTDATEEASTSTTVPIYHG